jgi:hypothetical protein
MKLWAKRRHDLVSARTQVVCRLHAVLCELVPGGSGQLYASKAAKMLDQLEPYNAIAAARHELGLQLLEDLRRVDEQMRETKKRIAQAVAASKTTLTEIFEVGPIVAATVIGYVGDVRRFASSDRLLPTTAPRPSKCPLDLARSTGFLVVATDASITPSTWPQSPRSATFTVKGAPTTTASSPRARRGRRLSAY